MLEEGIGARTDRPASIWQRTDRRARGALVNEQNLLEALRAGKPRAAATDVASVEPIASGNPLLQAPNLLITPHMAWGHARGA